MLRNYILGNPDIQDVLSHFDLPTDLQLIDVLMFRALTPDSFLWKLRTNHGIYMLYAEDYVDSISYVESSIKENILGLANKPLEGHFIKSKISAGKYEADELNFHAIDNGYDTVFLYKLDNMEGIDEFGI